MQKKRPLVNIYSMLVYFPALNELRNVRDSQEVVY